MTLSGLGSRAWVFHARRSPGSLYLKCVLHTPLLTNPTVRNGWWESAVKTPLTSTNTALPTGPLDVTTTLGMPSPAKYWFSLKNHTRFTWICGCVYLLINLQKLGVASGKNTVSEWRIVLRCFLGPSVWSHGKVARGPFHLTAQELKHNLG